MKTFFKHQPMRKQRQVQFVQVQPMHRPMSKGYDMRPFTSTKPTEWFKPTEWN
jgi:hypothetical protein